MCVKIIYDGSEANYDMSKPLELQIKDSKKIVVDYDHNDESIQKFMDEVERFCDSGLSNMLNIRVVYNNSVLGMKSLKKMEKTEKNIQLNKLIKLLALSHAEVDRKLSELAEMCTGGQCNVKS